MTLNYLLFSGSWPDADHGPENNFGHAEIDNRAGF